MTRELKIGTWRLLRALVREPRLTGRALRMFDYSRKTKSGTFLDDLVASGLLRAVETHPDDTQPGFTSKPVQFCTVYELTECGRHAAEYGEYSVPDRRPEPAEKTPAKRKSK